MTQVVTLKETGWIQGNQFSILVSRNVTTSGFYKKAIDWTWSLSVPADKLLYLNSMCHIELG